VIQALELDRRQVMVNDWLAGLRRRASPTILHQPAAPPAVPARPGPR
jgi:hypothetical protein